MTSSAGDPREFAAAFQSLLHWVQSTAPADDRNEVVQAVRAHLGPDRQTKSVVVKDLPVYEQVNLQAALEHWMVQSRRTALVQGIAVPPNWGELGLQQLITGDGLPPVRLASPELVDLPNGPGTTLACLQTALVMVEEEGLGRYVVMVRGPAQNHQPTVGIEIAGLDVDQAQAVHAELAVLRSRLNVYRGQVVEVSTNDMGSISLTFASLPKTGRSDVVLPDEVLRRIERHTIEVMQHRDQLLAAGQHLKRGLLLFGPPGTGKTHTTRYVVNQLTGYTVLLLSGRSLHLIGSITEFARELQPSAVVLEDVDLVAEDRGFGHGSSPVLFELLDAMDGAAADADLLFLLTTNRADLLEPALAARPGRVDVAVEIGLPDALARRRLLDLYGRTVPLTATEEDLVAAVERTEGTTASFLKELIRRAVLESLRETTPLTTVTGAHLAAALDDLLDSAQEVTRALLGVGGGRGEQHDDDDDDEMRGQRWHGAVPGRVEHGSGSWTAYTPLNPG